MKWWEAVLFPFVLLGMLCGCVYWIAGVFVPKLPDTDPETMLLGAVMTVLLISALGEMLFAGLDKLEWIRHETAALGKVVSGLGVAIPIAVLAFSLVISAIKAGDVRTGALLVLVGLGSPLAIFSVTCGAEFKELLARRGKRSDKPQRKKTPAAQPKPKPQEPAKREKTERTPENVFEGTRVLFRTEAMEERGKRSGEVLYRTQTIVIDEDSGTLLLVMERGEPNRAHDTAFEEITYARFHALLQERGVEALQRKFAGLEPGNYPDYLKGLKLPDAHDWMCISAAIPCVGKQNIRCTVDLDDFVLELRDYGVQKALYYSYFYDSAVYGARAPSHWIRQSETIWLPENFFEGKTTQEAAQEVAAMLKDRDEWVDVPYQAIQTVLDSAAPPKSVPAARPATEPDVPPEPPPSDGFEVRDGVLIRYTGHGGTVVVPEGVTEIGKRAFEGCSTVTDVVLPQSLRAIGDYAFRSCRFLKYPAIPEGVTIGRLAFAGTANSSAAGSATKPQAPAEPQRKKTPAAQPKPKPQAPVKRERTERTLENVFKGMRLLFLTEAKEERDESGVLLFACKKVIIDEYDGTLLLVTERGRPNKLQPTAFEEIPYARMHALLEACGIAQLQERFRDLSLSNFLSYTKELSVASRDGLCLAGDVYYKDVLRPRSRSVMPIKKVPPGLSSCSMRSMQLVDYGFQKAIDIDACYYDKRPCDYGEVIWLPENFFEDKTPAQAARDVEQILSDSYEGAVSVTQLTRFFKQKMKRMPKAPVPQKQQAPAKREKKERALLDVYTGARLLFLTEAREEGDWSKGETVHTVKRLVIDERDGTLLLVTERGKPNKLRVTAFEEISYARLPALLEARGVEALQRKYAGLTPSHYTEFVPELPRAYENASLCISPALPCVGRQEIPCTCTLDDFELVLLDFGVQKALYYSGTWDGGLAAAYGSSRPIQESGEFWLPENYFEAKSTQEAAKDLAAMLICDNTMADVPYEAIQAALEGAED